MDALAGTVCEHDGTEPGWLVYAPSQALADFVRCRDLTCRWPASDQPAIDCDLDHTISAYSASRMTVVP